MIVPSSVTQIKLTGDGQIATMIERILKEGQGATQQIEDIVHDASNTQSMSPDPDDTESPTAIKAKKVFLKNMRKYWYDLSIKLQVLT